MRRLITTLENRRITLEQYLTNTRKDLAGIEAEFAEEGRRRITNTLVLNAIAAEQNITLSDADLDEEIRLRAARIDTDADVMRRVLTKQNELEPLRNSLFIRKLLEYLKSVSVIREES
jgi:trigger factor